MTEDASNVTKVEVWEGHPLDGYWYYRAKARNGEIVAQSEGYTRKEDAERAAKETFPGAFITDKVREK